MVHCRSGGQEEPYNGMTLMMPYVFTFHPWKLAQPLRSMICTRSVSTIKTGLEIPIHNVSNLVICHPCSKLNKSADAQLHRELQGPDAVTPEVCRHGAAGIASHVHNMVLKICCEQAEPIWFKGGYVHPIYKQKGALDDPTAYRGVVLLDVYGKKFHAWLRQRLVPVLQHRKTAGQLGGLPCEQTLTGSHLLRVHGQVARALKISSAVVFVDVRAAFHHMLRELIFLQGSPALHPGQNP